MQKKIILSTVIVLLTCALFVVAIIYLFPVKTTSFDTTVEATQLDSEGNIIGTTQVVMQGAFKEYLFDEPHVELSFGPLGEFTYIDFTHKNDHRGFVPLTVFEYYNFSSYVFPQGASDFCLVSVLTSRDFEYWCFQVQQDDKTFYYVASFSGEHTVEEIVQHFKGLAPGYKAP